MHLLDSCCSLLGFKELRAIHTKMVYLFKPQKVEAVAAVGILAPAAWGFLCGPRRSH